MRLLQKIGLVLSCIIYSFSLIAQDLESDYQKVKKNAVFCSIGSFRISGDVDLNNKHKKDFSPSVEIGYNRLLFKNASMGVMYSYKKVSEQSYHVTGEEIPYIEKDNALLVTINYKIPIYNFFVTPTLAYGVCYAQIALSDSYGLTAESYRFAKYPGISIGYSWNHLDAFLSYRLECYRYPVNFKSFFIATWTFPSVFIHNMFKLGFCYKF